ncbi:fumarylacetoacetate hydrolase, partial [Halomonas sp. WWR20]
MTPPDVKHYLPSDADQALLVGRVWRGTPHAGPAIVVVRQGRVIDISSTIMTMADLIDHEDPVNLVLYADGDDLGTVASLLANSLTEPRTAPYLLAPCDLQAIKACGVTFAVSLLERV